MDSHGIVENKTSDQAVSSDREVRSPPYNLPITGWMAHIPASWVPFAELMRLDRPNGFWYFYLPHLYGTLHAATHLRSSVITLVQTNMMLVLGTIVMRGATCTWNDTLDAPFDRRVPRTRNRPIARGAVSSLTAHAFTLLQSLLSLAILTLLPPLSFRYAIPAIAGWALYPLAKRVTYYPQVVLGFPMAWGVFMGSAAMDTDPLNLSGNLSHISVQGPRLSLCAFYAANVLWTLLYEIIYSHQDAAYDTKAGVKNIVILYQGHTKPLLVKLAIGQVILLASAGWLGDAGVFYWTFTVFADAVTLGVIIRKVKLDVPDDCAWWFRFGCCGFTGGTLAVGMLLEYAVTL